MNNFASSLTRASEPRPGPDSTTSSAQTGRTLRVGDIGFGAYEAVQDGVDKKHHVKTHEEMGIHQVNFNKKHQFGQLPGITFNEKSFTNYIATASSLRRTMQQQVSPLKGTSTRKVAGHY